VIREMAEESELPDVRALPVVEGLGRVVARGDDTVRRTPDMLDKLREAGVVDAGGAGLVELVRGVLHELTGEPLPDVPEVTQEITEESIHHEESEYRYCTVFVVEGDALDLDALHASLEPLGDSLLVTGDASVAKVHVHTDEPEGALDRGRAVGVVDAARVEIGDMHSQASERERWLAQLHAAAQAPPAEVALVAVAQGGGNRDILRSEGAEIVIEGGQTMNPSVGQILEGVTAVNADRVIVLPNNSNVRLAAENAAAESTKDVRVRMARTISLWTPTPRPWMIRKALWPRRWASTRYSSTTPCMSFGGTLCRSSTSVMGIWTGSGPKGSLESWSAVTVAFTVVQRPQWYTLDPVSIVRVTLRFSSLRTASDRGPAVRIGLARLGR